MKRKRAILWDNDGVLVDTERWFFEANRLELAALGVTATWAEFEEVNLRHGVSLLSLSGLEGDELRALHARRDARYSELLRTENLAIPGMLELLQRTRAEVFTAAIVTSSLRQHFDLIHAHSGMLAHVDFAVVREDYAKAKPHPDPHLVALTRAGLSRSDCLAVEDSPRGVAAARAAGLDCILFTPGGSGADRAVDDVSGRASSPDELEALLARWLRE